MSPALVGGPYRSAAGSRHRAPSQRILPRGLRLRVILSHPEIQVGSVAAAYAVFAPLASPGTSTAWLWPVVTLGIMGIGAWRAHARLRLLRRGRLAHARLVHRGSGHPYGPPDRLLGLDFEDDRGRARRLSLRTTRPDRLTAGAPTPVLYDPEDSRRAVLLATLPGSPRVLDDDRLEFTASPWDLFALLTLPCYAGFVVVQAILAILASP